ncbi:MAG: histidine phosphatase family protein [Lentisphaerae bacterium]|nr:histidine phosphatase family protein [Lentisphaerota bacterium]
MEIITMTTEFFFVRHGETGANLTGVLQGQGDCPLNSNGLAQADAVANYLRETHFDVIYTSDLSRAAETAGRIAACGHENVPLIRTPELREMDCGELEGKAWDELRIQHADKVNTFYREISCCFPGGESKDGFQLRISTFLDDVLAKHRGEKVLLVSHGGVLQRIFRHIAGAVKGTNLLPLAGNASISGFIYSEKQRAWQLTFWNFTEHLKNLPQHKTLVL